MPLTIQQISQSFGVKPTSEPSRTIEDLYKNYSRRKSDASVSLPSDWNVVETGILSKYGAGQETQALDELIHGVQESQMNATFGSEWREKSADLAAGTPPATPTVPAASLGVSGNQPTSNYTGVSIVDYLKSVGQASDFNSRATMAKQVGIPNYIGSAEQNTQLLGILRGQGGNLPQGGQTPATGQADAALQGQIQGVQQQITEKQRQLQKAIESGYVPGTPTGTQQIPPEALAGEIKTNYGVDVAQKNWVGQPLKSFEDVYQQMIEKIDLAGTQKKIDDITMQINQADKDYQTAMGGINENPWLSEAGRVGKIAKLQEQYELTKSRLGNAQTALQNSYDRAKDDARNYASLALSSYNQQYQIAKDQIDYATARAEADAKAKLDEKKFELEEEKFRYEQGQPISLTAGITAKNLTATDRAELAIMDTAMQMSQNLVELGESIGWEGVGGLWQGSIDQWLAQNFGKGSPEEQQLRSMIGNVRATIAKLRGGTSFTANEEKLLNTYTPGINDSPMVIKSKVNALTDFINLKRNTVMGTAGIQQGGQGISGQQSQDDFSDIEQYLEKGINEKNKTVIIPRSVWKTLGDRMDTLLEDVKGDGYELLITD